MTPSPPAVSIIATILNEAETVPALLTSLQAQTSPPDEVVIVDGGSIDGTWEQLLAAQASFPALRAIRDESCSRKFSRGPIARGRNVAIHAAKHELIACADGGCRYDPYWLEHLTLPLRLGKADYVLGGSRLDLRQATIWDVAAAPFLGVRLDPMRATKSCTARSMAFTRVAWSRAGGFPEALFIGEDVLFDQKMRAEARTVFAVDAKAVYTPRNDLQGALRQMASYAVADGVAGMRPARLVRHVLRCVVMALALLLVKVAPWLALTVIALESYFAFRLDVRDLLRQPLLRPRLHAILPARLLFSLLVPWVVARHQLSGKVGKQYRTNRQNA